MMSAIYRPGWYAVGLFTVSVALADDWHGQLGLVDSSGRYAASSQRDSLSSQGLQGEFDYRDRAGLALGYRETTVDYLAALPELRQREYSVGGHYHAFPDLLPLRLTFSGLVMRIDNPADPASTATVLAPRLSLSDYPQRFRLGLGGARSTYEGGKPVRQQDLNLGGRVFGDRDWLELGAQRTAVDGTPPLQAYTLLWQHTFALASVWRPDWSLLRLVGGDRRYAVEADSATVYNLGDHQRGGVGLALHWRLGARLGVLLGLGSERFHNDGSGDDYQSHYLHSELSYQW